MANYVVFCRGAKAIRRIYTFLILFILAAVIINGCGGKNDQPQLPPVNGNGENNDFPEDSEKDYDVDAWIEMSRSFFAAQSREDGEMQYLLVTYGMKGSGGYKVEITNVVVGDEQVNVTVQFTRPAPGEQVTDAIEYPFDIVEIPATGLPAVFVATGAEMYVPHLLGVDYLSPVTTASGGIAVFEPAPQELIDRQFKVQGVANVFEGNIQYKLTDEAGTVLFSGYQTAAMGDWGYFEIDVRVDAGVPATEQLLLELFTESAKDGEVNDLLTIPLMLKQ